MIIFLKSEPYIFKNFYWAREQILLLYIILLFRGHISHELMCAKSILCISYKG
eukprot:UN01148